MSSVRPFLVDWVAGTLVVLAVGFAVWAVGQERTARRQAAALGEAEISLDAAIGRAHAKLDREQAAATARAAAARAQAAAAAGPKARPDVSALIYAHPELLASFVKAIRGLTEQRDRALFDRLHLTPDQVAKLEDLIVTGLENQLDLNSTAQAQGLSGDDPAIKKEHDQQVAELQAEEQNLLGPAAYAEYHTETRAQGIQNTVEQVGYMTQFSATPLSQDQAEQLTRVMAQASGDFRDGKDASAKTVDWDAVLSQAPNFLSSSQVATLQGVAQEARFEALARQFDAEQAAAK